MAKFEIQLGDKTGAKVSNPPNKTRFRGKNGKRTKKKKEDQGGNLLKVGIPVTPMTVETSHCVEFCTWEDRPEGHRSSVGMVGEATNLDSIFRIFGVSSECYS